MIMANRENMEKWAQALESGEYEQGYGALCTIASPNRYCCLGVACEVALANGVGLTITTDATGRRTYDGSQGFLPWKVSEWLGLDHDSDPVLARPGHETAIELNDGDAATFPEIAAMIRAAYVNTEQEN